MARWGYLAVAVELVDCNLVAVEWVECSLAAAGFVDCSLAAVGFVDCSLAELVGMLGMVGMVGTVECRLVVVEEGRYMLDSIQSFVVEVGSILKTDKKK